MTQTSEHINELAGALAKAQGQLSSASYDGLNPHFKSKYATLDSVWRACRKPLSDSGLSITQILSHEGDVLYMTTMLLHSSGQWIKSTLPVIAGKPTPQALGSAISYIKRYSLASLVGVTSGDAEDDDANAAQAYVQEAQKVTPVKVSYEDRVEDFVLQLKDKTGLKLSFNCMNEYLNHLECEKKVTSDKIMEQALNPALIHRFCKGWESWYEKESYPDFESVNSQKDKS